MWDKLAVLFKHYDLIICPTVATTRVKADFDYTKEKMWVKGKEVDGSKGWFMTYPFNTLGQCPVLAMPNGLADNGIPTSIQLVGRPYEEQHIFTAARFIEQNQPQQFYNEVFPDY
jgi:Asp-tRNA(Asn)/Glu-tRNA(Gln) amidotransferase A subunit family amidase